MRESFRVYISKIETILGIITPAVVLIFLGTFIPLVGVDPVKAFIIAVILLLTAIFIGLLSVLALLYAIKDELGVIASYQKSFSKIRSFLWVNFLLFIISKVWIISLIVSVYSFFVMLSYMRLVEEALGGEIIEAGEFVEMLLEELGGVGILGLGFSILFFILGIILFTKFFLAIYLLVFEGKKGIKALFASNHLVSGNFWKVLWRLLSFALISLITISLFLFLLTLIGFHQPVINIIGFIIGWLILPLFLIYGFLIYDNLRKVKSKTSPEISYQEPKIWKKVVYFLVGIFGLLGGILLLIVGANLIYRADDIRPINDADLRLAKVEILREDNAFYYFMRAREEVYIPREEEWKVFRDIVEDKKWDEVFVKNLLEKNEKAFYYFEKGIQLSYFQDPVLQDPKIFDIETPISSLLGIMDFARIKSIRAIYYFKQEEEEKAFDKGIQIIRKGQMFQDSPRSSLLFYLIGSATKRIGLETLRKMIPESELSPEILKDYITQLERLRIKEESLKNVFKMEYIGTINTIERFINIPIERRTNFFYKPNQTHKWFAEQWRFVINNVDRNCWEIKRLEEDPKIFPLLHFHLLPEYRLLLEENILGKTLLIFTIGAPEVVDIIYGKCERDFSLEATRLLIAIRVYQLENDRIPENLNRLVPRFISEIPRDPFDGQFIRFSPEKRMVWSVGRNAINENGDGDDIVFKIEF